MSELDIKNAIIKKAIIDSADRGFLTASLTLDYGNSGQGFGGFALYLPPSFSNHKLESLAGHFIFRCMQIADVGQWDRLVGKTIRVRGSHTDIEAIGHIINDDWFAPRVDFKDAK